jgi:hypothetical protein
VLAAAAAKDTSETVKDTAGAAQEGEGVAAGDVELRERGVVGEVTVVHLTVEEAVAEAGLEALVERRDAFRLVQHGFEVADCILSNVVVETLWAIGEAILRSFQAITGDQLRSFSFRSLGSEPATKATNSVATM